MVDAISGPSFTPTIAPESTSIQTNVSLAPTVSVEMLAKPDPPRELVIPPPPSSATRRMNGVPDMLLLRVDPSLLLKTEDEPKTPPPPSEAADGSVRTLDASLKDQLLDAEHRWSELSRFASDSEIEEAKRIARALNPSDALRVFQAFAEVLIQAERDRPKRLRTRDQTIASNWHESPWYLLDPRGFYNAPGRETSTFGDVTRGLEYVRRLGFENVALLPHYDADGLSSSGIVAHRPARELGGPESFLRLLEHASRLGLRVATSAPLGAVSLEHKWFEGALNGDAAHLGLFRRTDGVKLVGEVMRDGVPFARYATPSGVVFEEAIHDPEIHPHDHRILASTPAGEMIFHRSRYPWEVDLDIGSPGLVRHVLTWMAEELNQGVLGKVLDDVARWIDPVTKDTRAHSLLALLKLFARLLGAREVIIPIVALPTAEAARYTGHTMEIRRNIVTSEGDLFMWHRSAVALREGLCLGDKEPIEEAVRELETLGLKVPPLAWLEHHDELDLGLATSPEHAKALVALTLTRGGALARNGTALAGRLADVLDHDPQRIALAFFCLYMLPVVPLVYFGTEAGARSDAHHAENERKKRIAHLAALESRMVDERLHDPALLHRGPLAGEKASRRLRERYAPMTTLAALNTLRQKRQSLRGRTVTILPTDDKSLIAWVKRAESDRSPLLLIANLNGRPARVSLGLAAVRSALNVPEGRPLALLDVLDPLLGNGAEPPVIHTGQDRLMFALAPHRFVALEQDRRAPGSNPASTLRPRRS